MNKVFEELSNTSMAFVKKEIKSDDKLTTDVFSVYSGMERYWQHLIAKSLH